MYASCSLFFILPQTIMATVHPPKRRRTGHQLPPMVEGSDMSVDTAMYIHSEGGKEFSFQMFLLKHVWRVILNLNPTRNRLMNFSNPILILILPLQEIDGFIGRSLLHEWM